jgi:hypothetical protein
MKSLQIGTFRNLRAGGFQLRIRIRMLRPAQFVRGELPANTRILDAPTHGRGPPLARETPA